MSKRTQSPSLSQRFAALIRYWLDVPSRTELRESLGRMREDQIHTHRLWALFAIWFAQDGNHAQARRDLRQALDAFGQMEPPR